MHKESVQERGVEGGREVKYHGCCGGTSREGWDQGMNEIKSGEA